MSVNEVTEGLIMKGNIAEAKTEKEKLLPIPSEAEIESVPSNNDCDTISSSPVVVFINSTGISRIRLWHKVALLALLFIVYTGILCTLFMSFPQTVTKGQTEVKIELKFPKNMDDVRQLRSYLEFFQHHDTLLLEITFIALFLFFQLFIIPGSTFLSIIAGSMFGFFHGLVLVIVLSTVGSSFCFGLSQVLLRDMIVVHYPQKFEWMSREVHQHRHNLLNYMLFLRIVPIVPSWFINLASPIVGVPFRLFFFTTFLGLAPSSIISVQAGRVLREIKSTSDLYDARTICTLISLGVLSLLPIWLKKLTCFSRKSSPTSNSLA